jgi:NAD(P)-dependent dehydrogenase (short-subunit alcohol dehydrogenase family)
LADGAWYEAGMKIKDQVALVTGGASGLGAATAERLAAAGARVVILDRDVSRGEAKAAELGEQGRFVSADITSEAETGAAIAAATEWGSLRLVVGCAGIGWAARTINREGVPHDLEIFQKVINVNLVGPFNVLRLAASAMSKNDAVDGEKGVIINTASVAAFDGQIGQIAYASAKAGVAGMTLPAARDLAPAGIRVMTIAPGLFDTPMLASLPEEARKSLAASVVNPKRLGDPAEYAALVHSIAENAYLNGETIRLDGALRMAPK